MHKETINLCEGLPFMFRIFYLIWTLTTKEILCLWIVWVLCNIKILNGYILGKRKKLLKTKN